MAATKQFANLYICEKPSQARDLAKVLGLGTKHEYHISSSDGTVGVTWCLGHLLELYLPDEYSESWKRWSPDTLPIIPETWKYRARLAKRKPGSKAAPRRDPEVTKHLQAVKKLIAAAELITIATDYDREGEAIARLILDEYAKYKGPLKRLCLTALDDKSIRKSLAAVKEGAETFNLYMAALARSRADWLVGMNLSRLFTIASAGGGERTVLNIGRVTTPTIALVVKRQQEIENFVPKQYYILKADMSFAGCRYTARWEPGDEALDADGYVTNPQFMTELMDKLSTSPFVVEKYTAGNKKQKAPLPFDLTTLQQFANRRFGYTAKKTLDTAQSLYEKKLTTYPRTDCRYLPTSLHGEAGEIIAACTGDGYFNRVKEDIDPSARHYAFSTGKVTAHHAIIPTSVPITGHRLTQDEMNIYNLVRSSFIALFMPEAVYKQAAITLNAAGEHFHAKSSELVIPGWKTLYMPNDRQRIGASDIRNGSEYTVDGDRQDYKKRENDDTDGTAKEEINKALPVTAVGDIHTLEMLNPGIETTKPPQPFTEATLLGAMENIARYVTDPEDKKILKETDGLGTPATRADIIGNAVARDYLYYAGKHILPTEKGTSMINALPQVIKDVGVTARWEKGLEMIASGNMDYDRFMRHIEGWIGKIIDDNRNIPIHIDKSSVRKSSASGAGFSSSGRSRQKYSRRKTSAASGTKTTSGRKTGLKSGLGRTKRVRSGGSGTARRGKLTANDE